MFQQSPVITFIRNAALILLVLFGTSCRRASGPALIPVAGQVHVNGKPCSGAMIVFVPANLVGVPPALPGTTAVNAWPDGYPRAIADNEGHFHVFTKTMKDGAPAGKYLLTIVWPPAPPPEDPDGETDPPPPEFFNQDQLNGLYKDPAKSKIEVTVEGSSVEVPKIELSTTPQ